MQSEVPSQKHILEDCSCVLDQTIDHIIAAHGMYFENSSRKGVRQSAQLEENVNSSWNREVRAWGENEEVAKLMADGFDHYDDLPQSRKLMFHVRLDALMVEHVKQRQLADQNVWDGPTKESHENAILRMLLCAGGRAWWEESGELYPTRDYWNEMLRTHSSDTQPLNAYSWLKL